MGLWLRNVHWLWLWVIGLWLRDMISWDMWYVVIDHWSGLLSVHVSTEGCVVDGIESCEWISVTMTMMRGNMVRRSWWVVARWRVNGWMVARWLVSGWVIWFWFRWVIRLGLRVVGFGFVYWLRLWVWVMNLFKFERVKDGLNINSGEVFACKGLIKEIVTLHQLVLFHHIFALRFLFPFWFDVSVLNSPGFWCLVGLWLVMVNGWMIGFWFVVMNWLRMMIWFWFIMMHWLWLIMVNGGMIRFWFVVMHWLWFVITTWLLPMSGVDWISFLLNLWVIETFFVLVDAWDWMWVPELWVSKMITHWCWIKGWIGWCVMMDIRKRCVVWLMSWVCLWLVVWVSVDGLWSFVAVGLWYMVSWLWSVVSWLWNMVGFWCMVCWLWSVCDFQSVWIV